MPFRSGFGRYRRRFGTAICLSAAVVVAAGCNRDDTAESAQSANPNSDAPIDGGAPWFESAAQARGLNFSWRSGHQDLYLQPEIIGGGAALFDMDNDGDLDAYCAQAGSLSGATPNPPDQLFRNRGDGTFDEVPGAGGASDSEYGMGIACGDYDNDSDIDLFVANVGPNVLYRNDGAGRFENVTASAGVAGPNAWSSSAAFVDYDRDGDLDLFVCNYLNWSIDLETECYNTTGAVDYCNPANYNAPALDTLYRNNGDGTFTDVTIAAGIDARAGTGLGVVCGDFNGDWHTDIFVANDGMPNHLWANLGDGAFVETGLPTGCALDQEGKAKAGMGVVASDYQDDGDLDLMVCNLTRESDSLYVNEGSFFNDATSAARLRTVSRPFTRFGLGWVDFDNDGWLDLYVANGRVYRETLLHADDPYAEPNLVFQGLPDGTYREVQPRGGVAAPLIATSRAAAFGDIDNDGGIDILVVNRDAPAYLLLNRAPARGNWIMLRVIDGSRDALGSTVKLRCGQRTITRDVRAAYSYMASNDPRIHIGLGPLTAAEGVTVRWLDGTVEAFGTLQANQIHTLERGKSSAAAAGR